MTRQTRSLVAAVSVLLGIFIVAPGAPTPVHAADDAPGLYKITQTETETTPIGCVGCPAMKSFVPTFEAQTAVSSTVASASEIDTFDTSAWDQATNTNKTFKGGCAVIGGGLKCWGDNSRGQLGNESTTSSLEVPVTATENGVALSGITDVSTNGVTTCVVDDGVLKCVGAGNWEGNYSKRYSTSVETRTRTLPSHQESNFQATHTSILKVYNAADQVIYELTSPNWVPDTPVSKTWVTLASLGSNVRKVQVGASNNSTPTICALLTSGAAKCAVVTAGAQSSISDSLTGTSWRADCDGLTTAGEKYEKDGSSCNNSELNGRTAYEIRIKNGSGTLTASATWTWADAGVSNAVDIAMPADSWGASNVCFAGPTTICRSFSAGEFGRASTVENGENSQAVYITSGFGPPGLCVYSNNTISCGAGSHPTGGGGPSMATKVTAVAVMARPLNIFFGQSQTMQKLYFLLPTGLLSADGWIFTCTSCGSTSTTQVLSPVTAFSASTATSFTYAQSVNGSTDNADYIPLTVVSGTRRTRSSVAISVKTASGESITGVSVRWTAPDAPGLLSSSTSSTLATDGSGNARSTLPSGPVTFSLAPPATTTMPGYMGPSGPTTTTTTAPGSTATTGGRLASGATLQAASITVLVGDTGTVSITVPDPPAIVQRKVSVLLPDGTPVPGATVQLKNTYLTYAYENAGGSTSSWSSRPRDSKGYMAQMSCAYCFVTPPRYATGSDGSVTFPSFNPSVRSGSYDADVSYDDGELNQNVKRVFASTNESVSMPFMASIKAAMPDADPSTPAKDADADPSTPETDVKTDSSGAVTVESSLVDEDNAPISDFTQTAEVVNDDCDKGGLVSSTAKSDSVCTAGSISSASVRNRGVSATGVRTSAACSSLTSTARTNSAGKASLVLCPTVSTKYRIRGKGAIASRTFCVMVNGVKCGASAAAVGAAPSTGPSYQSPQAPQTPSAVSVKKNVKVSVTKYLKPTKGTTATYKVSSGKCKLSKNIITTPKTSGTCVITMTQTAKKKVKGKMTLVRTKKTVRLKVG